VFQVVRVTKIDVGDREENIDGKIYDAYAKIMENVERDIIELRNSIKYQNNDGDITNGNQNNNLLLDNTHVQ
jgi:hypothetical protein